MDPTASTNLNKHKSDNGHIVAVPRNRDATQVDKGDSEVKLELTLDKEGVDLRPFKFKPFALASMLDPRESC